MQKLQIFVYKSPRGSGLGLVRHPEHLAELGLGAALVTSPLSSSQAYEQLAIWKRRLRGPAARLWPLLARGFHRPHLQLAGSPLEESERVLARIRQVLTGRIIPEHRLLHLLRAEGYWPSQVGRALDLGVFRGEIVQLPGFRNEAWGVKRCSRCGSANAQPFPCRNCGSLECLLCLECSTLGEHRACSTLLAVGGSDSAPERQRVELVLNVELTTAQRQASRELLDFWERRQGKALVWAACGAGKTEVAFALIQRALEEGHEVLFAIPRLDIVREIVQRLRSSFPGLEIAAHHGGQPWFAPGRLVVATTHQVLHFYRRFGLVVLDEVDAFPFQGSEMLRFGLLRALAPGGQLVEMTATPAGPRPERVITIPARHHGFPLPEPELVVDRLPPWPGLQAKGLPAVVVDALGEKERPWLVFAPTIAACTALQRALAEALSRRVGLCHAQLPTRAQVIEDFRRGDLDILVTTSVLERGVNFPGIGVMVLYADHELFSVSALVQMAGRVGRTAQEPTGPVLFVASRAAPAMHQAVRLIRELNQEARRRGLLTGEASA